MKKKRRKVCVCVCISGLYNRIIVVFLYTKNKKGLRRWWSAIFAAIHPQRWRSDWAADRRESGHGLPGDGVNTWRRRRWADGLDANGMTRSSANVVQRRRPGAERRQRCLSVLLLHWCVDGVRAVDQTASRRDRGEAVSSSTATTCCSQCRPLLLLEVVVKAQSYQWQA